VVRAIFTTHSPRLDILGPNKDLNTTINATIVYDIVVNWSYDTVHQLWWLACVTLLVELNLKLSLLVCPINGELSLDVLSG